MQINTPKQAVAVAKRLVTDWQKEHAIVLLLNADREFMLGELVSMGSLSGSVTHPREVYKLAVVNSAASIILLHNHPSGNATPSPEDKRGAKRLKAAGEILGILFQASIIFTAAGEYKVIS